MTDAGPPIQKTGPVFDKPRRVRGGVRLVEATWPASQPWIARRWLEAVERCAPEAGIREGFEYARRGQTRSLVIEPGRIVASVQGRQLGPYRLVISAPTYDKATWESVATTMGDQAIHSAKLLAGDLTEGLEEVFTSAGMPLAPTGPDDLRVMCTCAEHAAQPGLWCKHACCVGLLVVQVLGNDPFAIFTLRGLPADDLLERLRERRAAAAGPTSGRRGLSSKGGAGAGPPLEDSLDRFWEAGPDLDSLETPLRPPEVSHALLRRLGPSPFKEGKFPLVGLLATCYDTISAWALRKDDAPPGPAQPQPTEPADEAAPVD